jgi:hypothetical protein
MSREPQPTIIQILGSLVDEILRGKTALGIAEGLTAADPVVLEAAPVFFWFTRDGLLELAQMYAAKLYDAHKNAVTVLTLLAIAEQQAGSFQNGQPREVRAAIAKAKTQIAGMNIPLASITKRRNEALAHLAPKSVVNRTGLNVTANLTVADLRTVFSETEKIVRTMDTLYSGVTGELRYLGQDDYEAVLDFVAAGKCAEAADYERLSGEKCFWPLPAKCPDRKP